MKEKNVFLIKLRCNIFIGVRIIKEMPGSVASGTPCIKGERASLCCAMIYDNIIPRKGIIGLKYLNLFFVFFIPLC